ncbi:hypothetical protein HK102_000844 [Quaeritorhiza haematococci]|nr:hypothetical protein HK102_000844 [Quaeritorhiza haematococci]
MNKLSANADTHPHTEHPKITQLRLYLNAKLRITVTDGRIFKGHLVSIDKHKNLILAGTDEFSPLTEGEMPPTAGSGVGKALGSGYERVDIDAENKERRFVGLVMIPGVHIIKAEVEELDDDFIL